MNNLFFEKNQENWWITSKIDKKKEREREGTNYGYMEWQVISLLTL